jgi:hypothetical protein
MAPFDTAGNVLGACFSGLIRDHGVWITDRMFPAGSVNQAMGGPCSRAIPFAPVSHAYTIPRRLGTR